jgi:DDE superfamily endonuclease./Tc5 transposase DNA-binding domain.
MTAEVETRNKTNCASESGQVISSVFLAHPLGPNATTERTNTARDERQIRSAVMLSSNNNEETIPTAQKVDKRSNNRGSAIRVRKTQREKFDLINEVEMAIDDGKASNTFDYFRNVLQMSGVEVERYGNAVNKWRKGEAYATILKDCVGSSDAKGMQKAKTHNFRSPFHEIEVELYRIMVDHRSKGRRVSTQFLQTHARRIYDLFLNSDNSRWSKTSFKASYGWLRRFMTRKNIKFRRKTCSKQHTPQEQVLDFEKFLFYLWFNALNPNEEEHNQGIDPLWGHFRPPECRYNMDQVPLPFVVNQDSTFALSDEENVHKCPSEALKKRQFTMHVVVNAGRGEKKFGWVDLVAKGTGKRIRAAETELCDQDVKFFWQANAWVDKTVMLELAEKFVTHKIEVHGLDTWVILICDNLRAHVDDDVKRMFGDAKVFLCYFPPNMTNVLQPIDAGIGRSLRTFIGHQLDAWLMSDDNLALWEATMTAPERRILMSKFVGEAMRMLMADKNDSVRVGSFERTGCLITLLAHKEFDDKIKPQGIKEGSYSIPVEDSRQQEFNFVDLTGPTNVIGEEESALADERLLLDEHEESLDDGIVLYNEVEGMTTVEE